LVDWELGEDIPDLEFLFSASNVVAEGLLGFVGHGAGVNQLDPIGVQVTR